MVFRYFSLDELFIDSMFRHVIDDDRILLVLTDGSQAFEIKDFLVQQERCKDVTIDNRNYPGQGSSNTKTKDKEL